MKKFRINQDELKYVYKSAKARMEYHPDLAEKYLKDIQEYSHFDSEKEALETAIRIKKEKQSICQIWAKVEKTDDGIYRIDNWWIASDDCDILIAAEYIGMAQMYDRARIQNIINSDSKIEDVIAYY